MPNYLSAAMLAHRSEPWPRELDVKCSNAAVELVPPRAHVTEQESYAGTETARAGA